MDFNKRKASVQAMDNKFAHYIKENTKVEFYGMAYDKEGKNYLLLLDYDSIGNQTITRSKAKKALESKARKTGVILDYVGVLG